MLPILLFFATLLQVAHGVTDCYPPAASNDPYKTSLGLGKQREHNTDDCRRVVADVPSKSSVAGYAMTEAV